MSSIIKELHLHGLDCAECANKIQRQLSTLAPDAEVTLNFTTGKVRVEIHQKNHLEKILKQVVEIIKTIEPGVEVIETTIQQKHQKTVLLLGLDCAHCATLIEKEISNLSGIQKASLNFITKQLSIEIEHPEEADALMKTVTDIINDIEGGIQIIEQHVPVHQNLEREELKERVLLVLALALFLPPLLLSMNPTLEMVLFLSAYILSGWKVLFKALRNIIKGNLLDENFLMGIATMGALAIGETPEAVAVMIFYQTGELFQSMAVRRSRRSIQELLNIKAEEALLITDEGPKTVSPESVEVGRRILVRPGDRVPLDGVVQDGTSVIDVSALTGESLPKTVEPGDEVLSGSVNLTGVLQIQTSKPYSESTVARILNMVENAATRKAPTEQFITRFARYYTPAVVAGALVLAFVPPAFSGWADLNQWVYRALVFLVISCPCALMISIPLGFFGGIGAASRNGILIKGSNYLEALHDIHTVVFDKTGTLTEGRFTVETIYPAPGYDRDTVLEWAALGESWSTHPIARSIRSAWKKPLDPDLLTIVEEVTGKGIKASTEKQNLVIGTQPFLEELGIPTPKTFSESTSVHIALDGIYIGTITVTDTLKKDSLSTISVLRQQGVQNIIMVTGDVASTASKVADALGIQEVFSGLLPHEKSQVVEGLHAKMPKGKKLLFAGDGINDAPVLTLADVGVAMGALGSDAAIEAADVVLMTDEPSKINKALSIAQFTRTIVIQNIVLALGVKGLVLILGAGGLATLWEAVFADVGVALLAVLNSMRVMKKEY